MIERANLKDLYPLSPLQEGMLFHALLNPESAAYLEQFTFRISGVLDLGCFEAALEGLVERHDILRTCFVYEKTKRPLQAVLRQRPVPLAIVDLRLLSEQAQRDRIAAYQLEDRGRPFDLTADPLMRVVLFQTGEDTRFVVWTHHHILMDGWSVGLLQSEFFQIYDALARGRSPALAPRRPYSQYIQWLESRDNRASLAYWADTLAGCETGRGSLGGGSQPAKGAAKHGVVCGGELSLRVRSLALNAQVTLNALLQTLWAVLLARYSGDLEVVVGIVVSGRPADLPGADAMIGLFINTIPARVRLRKHEGLIELCQRVQIEQLRGEPHHFCSLSELQAQSSSRGKLFDHLFVFENYPAAALGIVGAAGLEVEVMDRFERTDYDFVVVVQPGECLSFELHFDPGAYPPARVERIARHYCNLLRSAVDHPSASALGLSMLDGDERSELLDRFSGGESEYPRDSSIVEEFDRQAGSRPEAIALELGGQRWTYRELDSRAKAMAEELALSGVGPESVVGLHASRSLDSIAALLAILKRGANCLPLDPSYPDQRLRFMVEDSGPTVVISEEAGVPAWLRGGVRVLALSEFSNDGCVLDDRVRLRVEPDNAAYISYTSGSTGVPKGIAVTHRNVLRLVKNSNFAKMDCDQVFLQLAPLAFDASTLEIWGALLNGAKLVIMPAGRPTLAEIGRVLSEHRVTILWLTSSVFQLMVEQEIDGLRGVRQLLAGGEVLSPGAVRRALRMLPGISVINGYGPTENTTFTCCHSMTDARDAGGCVPIGRPVSNTRVYILDDRMEPVPCGVVGELYAGGDGVARGYVRRPEPTAERFVPDPFGRPGGRLYRTGDLARFRPDGVVEFVGRTDDQVKVRGFRIELGEVEAALRTVRGVTNAVVMLREDAPGGKSLVAYAAGAGGEFRAETLRAHLESRLPDYMVPSFFCLMDAFPLNANGKLDRGALPKPEALAEVPSAGFGAPVGPRDALEESMLEIWREVLEAPAAGMEEDFFQLGGHSLKATRVLSRVRAQFRVELPMRALFECPTASGLCRVVRTLLARPDATIDKGPALSRRARPEALKN